MLVIKKNTIWNPKIITPVLVKFLLFILLICSFIGSALAQNPNPNSSLDAAIQNEMNARNFPGAATIIVKNGEIVWVESYGYADVANAVQVEDTTVFLLASVSKLFTGTAAMPVSYTHLTLPTKA